MLLTLKYLCALLFVTLAVWVTALGFANFFSYQAEKKERQWIRADIIEEKASWDKAHSYLTTAMTLDPYNPNHSEIMGRIYVWRYYINDAPVTSIEEAEKILTEGLAYVNRSIKMRPAWFAIYSVERGLKYTAESASAKIIENNGSL
jgi:hypothetical protein